MTTSYLLNKCSCTLEKGWRKKQENRKMKTSSSLKKVPLLPRERLKRKTKRLTHSRDRIKNKVLQIASENVSAPMEGKFSFLPEKVLNKSIPFDVLRLDEETIMDKIIESLPSSNDEFYVIHEPETNSFSLRREDRK